MPTSIEGTTKLAFIGDLMIGRKVEAALESHEPEWFWGDVLPILQGADAVIANLECPITTKTRRWPWPKTWYFRANPRALEILLAGNIRCVNLANNHMLDFRVEGLLDTLEALAEAGIVYAGAGPDRSSAAAGKLLKLPELTVGFVAATDTKPSFAAKTDRPGTNLRRFDSDGDTLHWISNQSRALRQAGAETVILSVHWGPNMRLRPPARFQACARAALAADIDVIHGHSAHVFHGVEGYSGGVVLYDTGNFIDDYLKFPFRETLWTFVFLVDFEGGRPQSLSLRPVMIEPLSVRLARGREVTAICDLMIARCKELGVQLQQDRDGLCLDLRHDLESRSSKSAFCQTDKSPQPVSV